MSKFSDYFKSLKEGNQSLTTSTISIGEMTQHIAQRWRLSVPKSNAEKVENPTYISIVNSLSKTVFPYDTDIKPQSINAFGRYRGIIITLCHHEVFTNNKFRIIAFVPNKLIGSCKITKLTKPDETIEDINSLIYKYSMETTHLEDRPTMFKYIDSYSQQMFLTLAEKLANDDTFYFNKNLIMFDVTKELTEDDIDVLMSIMLNFMEYVKL